MQHQKFCEPFQRSEIARLEAQARDAVDPAGSLKNAEMRNSAPHREELHEDALEPEDDAEAASSQIAQAMGDRLPDPIKAIQDAKRPVGVIVHGDESKDADRPPVTPREDLDALSQRLGAEFFRAGTENRFQWCREFQPDGPRHTFSRLYAKERVLVDVYTDRNRLVVPEAEAKTAAIREHNEADPGDRWGYLAYVIREGIPSVDACRRALAGECVPLAAKPVEKYTLAQVAS